MPVRHYLRPVAFVDAPFLLDGEVARLAGGMLFFSAVEIAAVENGRRTGLDLVPVGQIEAVIDRLGPTARKAWTNIVAPRAPLQLGARTIRLDQPQVMGILNVTPDSFSDGGRFGAPEAAADVGFAMATAGAALIDVGGESTRPGAKPVWEQDEAARIEPVVRRLAGSGTAVSIDTRKALVMETALAAGAGLVNDVSALTFDPDAAKVVARASCPIVLMHHLGTPETMQDSPHYESPVQYAVYDWLEARIEAAIAAGIAREQILVDPGIGFGKTVQHNLAVLNHLALYHGLGCPIVLGASRKRMIGALSGEAPADQRLPGSLALALKAADQGVQIVRVHDVPETVQALRLWRGLRDAALTPG
ncbi:dihydropteroate synthase [Sphingosinicella sp. BN140058]|uniref:dihydropteroate synthase n=1 Tax=Sphingosinicella sp. BN140058 TaxID=1892855 RepID=UPI001013C2B0|nr:dihydropteroate synthase [Sphingosinicella sp. BN140058]QAY78418.1 dihydropteroate synthase [Sphingosinicella sp. BN140058]